MSWRETTLGEITDLKRGFDLPKSQRLQGDVPVYSSSGITGSNSTAAVEGPCVITGRYGTIGEVFFSGGPCWPLNTALYSTEFNGNNPRFVYYLLQTIPWQGYTTASAVPGVNRNHVNLCPVKIPDKATQDAIVEVLDSIVDKIALNNQLNDYLLELATSLFDERIKDSFEYTTVREYVKYMSNGSTPSRKNSSYWDDGTIPWIKTGEVNNKLIFDTSEHITKHALEKTSVHLLPKDTVIMALYGSGTAGRLALLQSPATTNQACTAMICESSSEAFYLFVVLKKMYHEIDNLTRGSVQQNLSKEIVANLRVPNVKKDILDSLGFNVIYSQIAFSEAETLNLTKLRDALLPRLMSGEIDVSKVDLTQLTNNHLADC